MVARLNDRIVAAIEALREDPRRRVYEFGDARGNGAGLYGVDYQGAMGVDLTPADVEHLVAFEWITPTSTPGYFQRGPRLATNGKHPSRWPQG